LCNRLIVIAELFIEMTFFWTFIGQTLYILVNSVVVPLRLAGGEDGVKRAEAVLQRMRYWLMVSPIVGGFTTLVSSLSPWIDQPHLQDKLMLSFEVGVDIATIISVATVRLFGGRVINIIDGCIAINTLTASTASIGLTTTGTAYTSSCSRNNSGRHIIASYSHSNSN
jgi:hypothetical protein